jgi:hypothetical protein
VCKVTSVYFQTNKTSVFLKRSLERFQERGILQNSKEHSSKLSRSAKTKSKKFHSPGLLRREVTTRYDLASRVRSWAKKGHEGKIRKSGTE